MRERRVHQIVPRGIPVLSIRIGQISAVDDNRVISGETFAFTRNGDPQRCRSTEESF